jgi:hypothetical protein
MTAAHGSPDRPCLSSPESGWGRWALTSSGSPEFIDRKGPPAAGTRESMDVEAHSFRPDDTTSAPGPTKDPVSADPGARHLRVPFRSVASRRPRGERRQDATGAAAR